MKIGQEIQFHGARAQVYKIDGDKAFIELLEDTPAEGDAFAQMVIRDSRDPLGAGGHKGDCFMLQGEN